MSYRDLKKAIDILEQKISTLPKGYIAEKTIMGKSYYYRQWHEDGKTRSKYVKKTELEAVRQEIAERRSLEARLKELQDKLPAGPGEPQTFHTNVLLGAPLANWASAAEGLQKRDCYEELQAYLQGDERSRVCLVYGLRRTGKTTMLQQAVLDMDAEELSKTAMIQATENDSFESLNEDLKKLAYLGYKNVLIDEATFMPDFINSAALLPDIYAAQGMKIVLSGTDSLGFWFAKYDSLYDRTRMIHTTFIPFQEHSRLIGTTDIDTYIQYGGTLEAGKRHLAGANLYTETKAPKNNLFVGTSFATGNSADKYIETAVCTNIEHTLAWYKDGKHFRHLKSLYDAGELTNVIARYIQKMNHQFALSTVRERFKSRDYGSANDLLKRQQNPDLRTDILDYLDKDAITAALKKILDIKEAADQKIGVTEAHLREIKEYLSALELIDELPLYAYASTKEEGRYGALDYFNQPGIRFAQTEALIEILKQDPVFENLDAWQKNHVRDTILNDVRGRMLEQIVLIETMRALKGTKEVFQYTLTRGEYDMVIYDPRAHTCEAYEIKHSEIFDEGQIKHLADPDKIANLEKMFGTVTKRGVIYRGEEFTHQTGIVYLNAEKYLSGLQYPVKDWVRVSRERFKRLNELISDASFRSLKTETKAKKEPKGNPQKGEDPEPRL